ncbi:MAG TPA: hypothetical protein VFW78_13270 [Bacteroidia bacterium]|nr:hypothetical protein [Bacteroidia bacterium]
MKAITKNLFSLQKSLITILLCYSFASNAQVISENFDKLEFSENFDSTGEMWTTLADAENLFIVQDGEYILQRKAQNAPYAILAGKQTFGPSFRILTALKIDKSFGEQPYAGLMLMMQPQGQGGFLVEISMDRKYRIRQIVSGSYRYITGTQKEGGWLKCNALDDKNNYNAIDIRVDAGNYDLYFNNKFVQSFSEKGYRLGQTGFLIGPATRAKIDYLYVFSAGGASETSGVTTNTNTGENTDIIALTESIISLKTELNATKEENEGLRKTLSAMRSGEAEKDVTFKNYEKQINNLEAEIKRQQFSSDSLQKINTELAKYKEMVGSNANGDLVITLSKALKSEKEKNAALEQTIKELKEQSNTPKGGGPKSSGNKPKNSSTESPDSGTISLPIEN